MADVTYVKTVSDANVRAVIQRIANVLNRSIRVHSGDRNFVPSGGSRTSLHLAKRAADFHITGVSDAEGFRLIKSKYNELFDATEAYEMIHHGDHTATGGPHLHLGRYGNGRRGYVDFKVEGTSPATKGNYRSPGSETRRLTPGAVTAQAPGTAVVTSAGVVPPSTGIPQSVGVGGVNVPAHVTLIQALLNKALPRMKQAGIRFEDFAPIPETGYCGDLTKRAITIFQRDVMGMARPDGRIDPGGRTMRALYTAAYKDPKTIRVPQIAMTGGAKAISLAAARDQVQRPEIRAMLETIAYSEGTRSDRGGKEYGTIVYGVVTRAPYNPEWVGKRSNNLVLTNFSRYPDLLVLWRESRPNEKDSYSSAVGRYQFLRKTWTWMAGYGLKDFSPASQDLAAVMLMQYRAMIGPLLTGDIETAIHNGSEEWASLPKKGGGGSYAGQRAHAVGTLKTVYQTALQNLTR